jgi:general secretion pathway protein D
MMTEQHFRAPARRGPSHGGYAKAFILAVTLSLCSSPLLGAEQDAATEAVAHKVLALKHISAKQGRKYLAQAKIGTVSPLPGVNALLVTAPAQELAKAAAILQLMDCKEQFVMRAILPGSAARTLPSNQQIAAAIGDVSVGDFSNPPAGTAATRAIIDIHNDAVVLVAPASQLERIMVAIESAKAGQQPGKQDIVPAAEPNEPKPVVSVQEQEAPEPNATEGTEAKQPAIQPEPGPKPEPKIEPGVAKIESAPDAAKVAESIAVIRPYQPGPIPNGEEVLKMDLPEKMDIVLLLSLAGEYLNLNFIYDPVQVKGDVTLKIHGQARGPVKVKDLYPLLESVLKFKGFAMTRRENWVMVVSKEKAQDIDPALLKDEDRKIERGDVVVTGVFTLEHIDTASATSLLASMKLGQDIAQIAETKTLIITEYAYRMPRIEEILELVDKPGEKKKFRFRPLKYTMARTLAEKVKTLAEQLGTVSVSISAPTVTTTPRITRRTGESDAAYQARLRAAELAARRAMTRTPTTPTTTPTEPSVYLDADERTNRILMIGLEEQLGIVEELIETLDVEQQDLRTLQLYKIEYVDAEEARKKLEELGIVGASRATSGRITQPRSGAAGAHPGPPRSPTTSTTAETTEPLVEEPQVVVIETTNSLLINATAEQHAQITTILGYVDSQTEEDEIPYKIYPLENSSPEHLTQLLEKLIQETVTEKEDKIERERVVRKQEEQITIVPDPNTYSLIVYASKKNQEWISNLIETLDKRRPQVLIDVTLVEISKSDKFEYDLELIESFPDLTKTSGVIAPFMDVGDPVNLVEKLTGPGSSDSRPDRFIDFQTGGGMGTGFYADKHINALLTAMQTKDYGRVLAKPKILVNDNQKGTISTTDTTYVAKRSSVPVSAGAAGQQTTLIETAVSFEPYPAGINLDITPHISKGNLLQLVIVLTRSDFGTITGEKPPDTTESNITTSVTVPDGSTIILGGMLKLNQSKGGSKVPLLGDIPIIGALFRSVSNNDLQRNLYVFVKAEIIRPAETLAQDLPELGKISDRNRMAFEKFEQEFQSYQNFPGVKPKPVQPVKVLEAQ